MKELIYSYDLTVAALYAKGAQPQVILKSATTRLI